MIICFAIDLIQHFECEVMLYSVTLAPDLPSSFWISTIGHVSHWCRLAAPIMNHASKKDAFADGRQIYH